MPLDSMFERDDSMTETGALPTYSLIIRWKGRKEKAGLGNTLSGPDCSGPSSPQRSPQPVPASLQICAGNAYGPDDTSSWYSGCSTAPLWPHVEEY